MDIKDTTDKIVQHLFLWHFSAGAMLSNLTFEKYHYDKQILVKLHHSKGNMFHIIFTFLFQGGKKQLWHLLCRNNECLDWPVSRQWMEYHEPHLESCSTGSNLHTPSILKKRTGWSKNLCWDDSLCQLSNLFNFTLLAALGQQWGKKEVPFKTALNSCFRTWYSIGFK